MRLIDAKLATSYLTKARLIGDSRPMVEIFAEIPTAYDVDKVVAELEKRVEHCTEMHDWRGQSELEDAIEIVKSGG